MFENIANNVSKCISLSDKEKNFFYSVLEPRNVAKKTILLSEGEICQFEAYINKGCIRIYYIDENGFEVNLQFSVEDWWVSDIASFSEHKPSKLYIETLEDCELLILTPEKKEILLNELPKFEKVFRLLVQRKLSVMQDRLINTIAKTAEEKYLNFTHLYPTISQRVPQHYIAHYLGISPEFLSKIRTRLAKK
ncbi:Crp/Fnr family transcriptional regulator [Flavobacterium sp. XS2P12]|uniref:Crp/Fnr family transcriptional regulator n=1 Tax=Flavobacterium melibiosi TaxID=3398734 RepID=UPI003A87A49C